MNSVDMFGVIRNYIDGEIQCLGSVVSREVLESLRLSFVHFRDEIGTQLNHIRNAQGKIVGGGRNLAKAVCSKLTENSKRNEKREQVLVDLYQAMRKVMTEIGEIREATRQTPQEIVLFNQKLQGVNGNMKWEVRKSVGSAIRKYTESENQEDTKGDANLPSKLYLRGH